MATVALKRHTISAGKFTEKLLKCDREKKKKTESFERDTANGRTENKCRTHLEKKILEMKSKIEYVYLSLFFVARAFSNIGVSVIARV